MKPKFARIGARIGPARSSRWIGRVAPLLLATGCASDPDPIAIPNDADVKASGDASNNFVSLGTQLRLSVDDPDAWYAGREAHPWFQYSTVTHAESFVLRVTNEGRRAARDVQLLVAVPGDLPDVGWSVTIGNPAIVLSSPSDFGHVLLEDTHYPRLPHRVYWRQGNARFIIYPGPKSLEPGMTWEVPIQAFRGATENFMVHFDVAAVRAYANPFVDVTAQPPFMDGGEFR
jgi:hypothetical protein